jgi:hypothetical protein
MLDAPESPLEFIPLEIPNRHHALWLDNQSPPGDFYADHTCGAEVDLDAKLCFIGGHVVFDKSEALSMTASEEPKHAHPTPSSIRSARQ